MPQEATDSSIEGNIDRLFEAPEPEDTTPPAEESAPAAQDDNARDDEQDEQQEDQTPDEPEEDRQEEDDEPAAEMSPAGDVDDTDTDDSPDEDPPSSLHTVMVDGAPKEVSLEELKRGYSGQEYVQKGMQEAAQARKQAEQVFNQLQAERQSVGQFLQQIRSGLTPPPVEPDKADFERDPIAYMDAKLRYDEQKTQYDQQIEQMGQVAARQNAAEQQAMQVHLSREIEQLRAVEPEFRDQETATKLRERMTTEANSLYGYEPEEIAQIVDHRALRVLRDAMRYHELKRSSEGKREKAPARQAKPTGGRRAANRDPGKARRRKQKEQLKKTGNLQDAVGLLFS